MSLKDQIIQRSAAAGGRLRVRSALNPVLWLCAIVTVPCVTLATISDYAPTWLPFIAFTPIVLVSLGFIVLLFFDRDKLQSEDYQIRAHMLEFMREKGEISDSTRRVLEDLIANPHSKRLPKPDKDDE